MKLNLDRFTAAQLAEHVAAGDFSATEVAQASLEAIEAREGGVQAFLQVAPELALELPPKSTPAAPMARLCPARGRAAGPLRTT